MVTVSARGHKWTFVSRNKRGKTKERKVSNVIIGGVSVQVDATLDSGLDHT